MMGENGLQHSRWAHTGGNTSHLTERPGDWKCAKCHFSNFQWRTSCFRCSTRLDDAPENGGFKTATIPTFQTPSCSNSYKPQEEAAMPVISHTIRNSSGKGLAVSRWAPRNANGYQSAQTNDKVWTRTIHNPSQTPSRSQTPTPKVPDLGLPYQVQHYILSMIQRMLEESCYEFASRWIPDALYFKGWDCAEAVELSTWRTFLPTVLPPNAIRPMSNYTLEGALGDAVRIRNSAVHRHLCDNDEIQKMALQAQDLMSMFADGTRGNKFHRLWLELKAWDVASKGNAQDARGRLEEALQGISERPLDDMDWSPNAMSLQEITVEEGPFQELGHSGYVDEMELD